MEGGNRNSEKEGRCGVASCEVLVGSRGWDHEQWVGGFYPEDLPGDWRLTYYANAFRAVLVPADRLLDVAADEVEAWRDDVPEDFRFYFEISRDLMMRTGHARFLRLLDTLGNAVEGVSLRFGAASWPSREQLEPWLDALCGQCRLAASFPVEQASAELKLTLAEYGVAASWWPGVAPWTQRRGCMGFLETPSRDLRELRKQVEAFVTWAGDCERALLCFEVNEDDCRTMQQGRIIAELLGA